MGPSTADLPGTASVTGKEKPKRKYLKSINVELHDNGGATVTTRHAPRGKEYFDGTSKSAAFTSKADAHAHIAKVMGIGMDASDEENDLPEAESLGKAAGGKVD